MIESNHLDKHMLTRLTRLTLQVLIVLNKGPRIRKGFRLVNNSINNFAP